MFWRTNQSFKLVNSVSAVSLFNWINLGTIAISSWCFSFAATNFGAKISKLNAFRNTTGFKYISEMDNNIQDKLYDQIVKVSIKARNKAPDWAKDRNKLKTRCESYQYSLRYWEQTSKYCLVQNNVRHKLVEDGITLKETISESGKGCTEELLNSYADGKNSLSYLIGKKECAQTTS